MNHVLFHGKCYDGFGAAYAAWKWFGDKATYTPVTYGKEPPQLEGDFLFILDFSFPPEILLNYLKTFQQVVVLDHHKTAQEMLTPLIGKYQDLHIEFDMNRSGALMTWNYFHGEDVPELIKHISDRDLWQFKVPFSKEVHEALVSHNMNFKEWDKFNINELIEEGKVCNRLYEKLIRNICEKAYFKEIAGYNVPVVNTSIAWSEVGNYLLDVYPDAPFAASFTIEETDNMWSLRSNDSRVDVSEVAKKFGGGGHRNAAGFREKTTKTSLKP